jgi:hypothetical protein
LRLYVITFKALTLTDSVLLVETKKKEKLDFYRDFNFSTNHIDFSNYLKPKIKRFLSVCKKCASLF